MSSGRASTTELGTAAVTLVHQCVVNYGYGGTVSRFGEQYLDVICDRYFLIKKQVVITTSK